MPDLSFLEFHRSGFGLLPHPNDREPGTAIQVPALTGTSQAHRSCTCRTSKKKTCPHLLQLSRLISGFSEAHGGRDGGEVFAASWWHRLGQLLHEGGRRPYAELLVAQIEQEGKPSLVVSSPDGSELLRYFDHSPAALRLLERIGKAPATGLFADRAGLLQKLSLLLRTSVEQAYNAAGLKSHQQSFEESLWARLAYHSFREYGDRDLSLHPAIEEHSGDFTLTCQPRATGALEPLFRLVVPRRQVRSILDLLAREFPGEPHLAIHPIPLKSLLMVSPATEMDLEVRPLIQALQASGEARFLESEEVEKFRYGDLVYLREMQVLAELERPGAAPFNPATGKRVNSLSVVQSSSDNASCRSATDVSPRSPLLLRTGVRTEAFLRSPRRPCRRRGARLGRARELPSAHRHPARRPRAAERFGRSEAHG